MLPLPRSCSRFVFALVLIAPAAWPAEFFVATLNGAQMSPPVSTMAKGLARVTLDDSASEVSLALSYGGLDSMQTATYLHGPATAGTNAPPILTLDMAVESGNPYYGGGMGYTSHTLRETFSVTPQQAADLRAGRWYFSVQSQGRPGGEIRGQILADAPFRATLAGSAEVPAVTSPARGTGAVSLSADETMMVASVEFSGLASNQTMAHIHGAAPVGAEAGVLFNLGSNGTTAAAFNDLFFNFSAAQVAQLKAGLMYFNVHSQNQPDGEIRGQILATGASLFTATLNAAQEVPPTNSTATGTGQVLLNAAENQFFASMLFSGLGSNQLMAHIHGPAAPGTNAGILFDLGSQSATSGSFLGLSFTPTPQQVADLKGGRLYFNVHSVQFGAGEIRGQILPVGYVIGPEISGSWFDPDQNGHGLLLEVLPNAQMVAYWFTFAAAGGQAWFGGVGPITGNQAVIPAFQPTGPRFIPNFVSSQLMVQPWGTLTITFENCNNGRVDYNSTAGFGSGSMRLVRLTQQAGLSCP